jgi:hypothetical protein
MHSECIISFSPGRERTKMNTSFLSISSTSSYPFRGTGVGTAVFELAKLMFYCLSSTTSQVNISLVYFEHWVPHSIFPGWPQMEILPMSSAQVASNRGVSHWCTIISNILYSGEEQGREICLMFIFFLILKSI